MCYVSVIYTIENARNSHLIEKNFLFISEIASNDRADAEKLVSWGVDYITTNILEQIKTAAKPAILQKKRNRGLYLYKIIYKVENYRM